MRVQANSINAGSMADIAFLLLVFFLLVTKIDDEWGINAELPEYEENVVPRTVAERNVLEIRLGDGGGITIEDEPVGEGDFEVALRAFYLNTGIVTTRKSMGEFPIRRSGSLVEARKLLENAPDQGVEQKNLLELYNRFGECRQLPEDAVIALRTHKECSYDTYIQVLDTINTVSKSMRNELAMELFEIPFDELQAHSLDDAHQVIQVLLPERIVEPEGD